MGTPSDPPLVCRLRRFPVGETVLRWDGAKEATEMTDGVRDLSKVVVPF